MVKEWGWKEGNSKEIFSALVSFHQQNRLNPSVRINGSLCFSIHPGTGFNTGQVTFLLAVKRELLFKLSKILYVEII